MNKINESCIGHSKGSVFANYYYICNTAIPCTPQSETNVVNSGAVVGCQTRFDSVWLCLVWGHKGKSLGSVAHPAYKELPHCLKTKHIPVLCKRGPSPRQLLLKFQRCSWLACEGSSIALFPTPVLCPGVLWLGLVLVPEVLLYFGWHITACGESWALGDDAGYWPHANMLSLGFVALHTESKHQFNFYAFMSNFKGEGYIIANVSIF